MSDKAVASGEFVAQHLQAREADIKVAKRDDVGVTGGIPSDRVQPNGVDLTVGEVFRTSGSVQFHDNGEYTKPDRTKIQQKYTERPGKKPYYSLVRGQYPIVYSEEIHIPDGYVARVYPRSRLMRSGLHLTSALWDQGYDGIGEGLLQVPLGIDRVRIPVGMPIAQMSFISADEDVENYDGSHQEERLKVEA